MRCSIVFVDIYQRISTKYIKIDQKSSEIIGLVCTAKHVQNTPPIVTIWEYPWLPAGSLWSPSHWVVHSIITQVTNDYVCLMEDVGNDLGQIHCNALKKNKYMISNENWKTVGSHLLVVSRNLFNHTMTCGVPGHGMWLAIAWLDKVSIYRLQRIVVAWFFSWWVHASLDKDILHDLAMDKLCLVGQSSRQGWPIVIWIAAECSKGKHISNAAGQLVQEFAQKWYIYTCKIRYIHVCIYIYIIVTYLPRIPKYTLKKRINYPNKTVPLNKHQMEREAS